MSTGLTGLDTHAKSLDVIGHNIVNTNTVGFKSSRAIFETQLNNDLSYGTQPDGESGGLNPIQIGLGVSFAGTQKNFNNGALQPTGIATDLALEGPGFFILKSGGDTSYTRNGSFDLDANNNLVSTTSGGVVQGFDVDDSFNVIPGVLKDIQIPIGTLTLAKATQNVNLAGNLNTAGPVSEFGAVLTSQAFTDISTGVAATSASLLTDLSEDGVTPSFVLGNVITVNGIEKGGRELGAFVFEVNATATAGLNPDEVGTTVGEYLSFLQDSMGITGALGPSTIGVSMDALGQIRVEGDLGVINDINIQPGDTKSTHATNTIPFQFSKARSADGESVRTSFPIYDSLGTLNTIDLTIVLEDRDNTGTTWRYFAESYNDTDTNLSLGNGVLTFDSKGELITVSDSTIDINRNNTGATDPLSITLNFRHPSQGVSAFADTTSGSTLASTFQDGSKIGTLKSFSVGGNGIINGSFDNGLTRSLGQVALGTFANPEGLVDIGGNNYINGSNSGLAIESAPLAFGAGRIVSGALELSNVDLSQEFVNLITTSTGFSASSRVITTSDEMLQQLLAII